MSNKNKELIEVRIQEIRNKVLRLTVDEASDFLDINEKNARHCRNHLIDISRSDLMRNKLVKKFSGKIKPNRYLEDITVIPSVEVI